MRAGQGVKVSSSSVGRRNGNWSDVAESEGEWRVLFVSDAFRGRTNNSDAAFDNEGDRRALLQRMGTDPSAWVFLDTLARTARMSCEALRPKLDALEREGLVASKEAPAGPRYRLTEDGRRVRAGSCGTAAAK
jgi:DNA-binding HxlR family transcriptional regulator